MGKNLYEILGVEKTADEAEIKKAYRKIAMKYHPDKNPGDKASEDKFKEAAEAYATLGDKQKRNRYDINGDYAQGGFTNDMYSTIYDVFSAMHREYANSGNNAGNALKPGANRTIRIKATLEEIANGAVKKIKLNRLVVCSDCSGYGSKDKEPPVNCYTCSGTGVMRNTVSTLLGTIQTNAPCNQCKGSGKYIINPCLTCSGNGVISKIDPIEVKIPIGIPNKRNFSISQKGNASPRGRAGDLFVIIEEMPHNYFKRDACDLYYDLYVNFADATLGADISIPTLCGSVKIRIPEATQSGKVLRLKDKGMPNYDSRAKKNGNLFVVIKVWTPVGLTDKEKKQLQKLGASANFKPAPEKIS